MHLLWTQEKGEASASAMTGAAHLDTRWGQTHHEQANCHMRALGSYTP